MTSRRLPALALALLSGVARAAEPLPALSAEHHHPKGAFAFKTPADWTVQPIAGRSGSLEARSGPLRVRIFWIPAEVGYDASHDDCVQERLAPPMAFDPRVRYEYEFVGGLLGEDRRVLDSAFVVRYDPPLEGQVEWRQRSVTVVGGGETLCVVSAAPRAVWKKGNTRKLLDAIVGSLTFDKPPRAQGATP